MVYCLSLFFSALPFSLWELSGNRCAAHLKRHSSRIFSSAINMKGTQQWYVKDEHGRQHAVCRSFFHNGYHNEKEHMKDTRVLCTRIFFVVWSRVWLVADYLVAAKLNHLNCLIWPQSQEQVSFLAESH